MGRTRWRAAAAAGLAFAAGFAVWAGALALQQSRAGEHFDFARWELASVANKWLHALGAPLRSDPAPDEAIARYFALDERDGEEGRRLENAAEAAIEGRLDAALRELALGGVVPLPSALGVFPPVDLELTGAPQVLALSPRDRIELLRTETLRPDLTPEEQRALEAAAEAGANRSAIVLPLGGISTYPAIVTDRRSYASTLRTAAHEWTHHYLAFFPLGVGALGSQEARTINETVADIVGDEVGGLALARFGDPTAGVTSTPTPAAPSAAVDQNEVLRALRLEVDALLAEGRVEDAERRMEAVRAELEARGVVIRRINQAFFAWFGTYAARPDSVDPLGPQLFEVRELAGSPARFLELVRGATSREEVAEVLERARLEAAAAAD